MKEINGGYSIIYPDTSGGTAIKQIERVARTCYQSNANVNKYSGEKLVKNLISMGHEAMLEHFSVSVEFTTDRGVSHEIVRHRIASYAQESTRYCNYSKDKFGCEIAVISPEKAMRFKRGQTIPQSGRVVDDALIADWLGVWRKACTEAERAYLQMLNMGCPPELARGVLPTSLKTSIVVTMNLREWRHFFKLRVCGTTGKPHPQIYEIAYPLLCEFHKKYPVVFDDLYNRLASSAPYADKPVAEGGLKSAT